MSGPFALAFLPKLPPRVDVVVAVPLKRGGAPGDEVQIKDMKNGPPLEASLEQLYPP